MNPATTTLSKPQNKKAYMLYVLLTSEHVNEWVIRLCNLKPTLDYLLDNYGVNVQEKRTDFVDIFGKKGLIVQKHIPEEYQQEAIAIYNIINKKN